MVDEGEGDEPEDDERPPGREPMELIIDGVKDIVREFGRSVAPAIESVSTNHADVTKTLVASLPADERWILALPDKQRATAMLDRERLRLAARRQMIVHIGGGSAMVLGFAGTILSWYAPSAPWYAAWIMQFLLAGGLSTFAWNFVSRYLDTRAMMGQDRDEPKQR
jgi:hypothetical protein